MTKRFTALLLAACMALALFACGKSGQVGLRPGTYTGSGTGHGGAIEVQLTVDDEGRIAEIIILSESETPDYAAAALEQLPKTIVDTQSLVPDAIAGATLSSWGVYAAVADALIKAGGIGAPNDYGYYSVENWADGTEIVITGLPEGDLTLTGAQLKNDFEVTELEALSVNSQGTEKNVRAKGVLLETILQSRGLSQKDFDSATATATDGYSITVPGKLLQSRDILIAFETNGEAIAPRFVVPEERAMYWVKLLHTIALAGPMEPVTIVKVIALADLIDVLKDQAEDYQYLGSICKALPLSLVLEMGIFSGVDTDFVTIKSTDGLTKTEQYATFAAQMLLFEGTADAPLYIGRDLPAGMRVKNVESFQVGCILVKAD